MPHKEKYIDTKRKKGAEKNEKKLIKMENIIDKK